MSTTTRVPQVEIKKISSNELLSYVEEETSKHYLERKGLLTEQIANLRNKSAYGAFVGNQMAGFAVMVDGTGHMDALHITPTHRNHRIGTLIIAELGVTGLMVEQDNAPARWLYERLGFVPVSTLKDLVHYERILD